jgi:hypothetical protein
MKKKKTTRFFEFSSEQKYAEPLVFVFSKKKKRKKNTKWQQATDTNVKKVLRDG